DSGNSELASAAVPAPGDPVFGPAGPSAGAPVGAETSIGTEAALLGAEKPKLEGEGEGDAEGKDEEEEDGKSEGGRDLASLEEEPCPEGEEGERCRAEREAEKEKQGFLDDDFFEKLKLPESADDRPKGEWRPRAPRSLSEGVIQIG